MLSKLWGVEEGKLMENGEIFEEKRWRRCVWIEKSSDGEINAENLAEQQLKFSNDEYFEK